MTAILVRKFSGEIPRLPPTELPPGAAQTAINCDFRYGDLRPLPDDAAVAVDPAWMPAKPGGLWYYKALNRIAASVKPLHAALHTTNGVDRVFYTTGDPLPKGRSTWQTGTYANPLQVSSAGLGAFCGITAVDEIGFGHSLAYPLDEKAIPWVVGDIALSDEFISGKTTIATPNRYEIKVYYATVDADGVVSEFKSLPNTFNWTDVASPATVKNQLFFNKMRDLIGTLDAPVGGDIVLMARINKPAIVVGGIEYKKVPLGVVYTQNYSGTTTTTSSAVTSTTTSGDSASSSSAGTTTSTTSTEYPWFEQISNEELDRIIAQGGVVVGDGNPDPEALAKAAAAQAVKTARTSAPPKTVTETPEQQAERVLSGQYDTATQTFGNRLSFSISTVAGSVSADGKTCTYDVSATLQIGDLTTRYYTYTYVNILGDESAPGPVSAAITVDQGHSVRVSFPVPIGWANGYISTVRIYRTVTNSAGEAQFMFFREITYNEWLGCLNTTKGDLTRAPVPVSPFKKYGSTDTYSGVYIEWIDCLSDSAAGEVLPTLGDRNLPDGATHLQSFGNGMLCAIKGDELLLSRPFRPAAWPIANRATAPSRLIAAKTTANGVLLGADDGFYLATGNAPELMSFHRIPSASTMIYSEFTQLGDALVAATTDGIAMINGAQVDLSMSSKIWNSRQWTNNWTNLDGIVGKITGMEVHDQQLLVFGSLGSFLIDLQSGSLSRIDTRVTASCYAPALDACFIAGHYATVANDPLSIDTSYSTVKKLFGGTGRRPYTYDSGIFRFDKPLSLGALKIKLNAVPTSTAAKFTLYMYNDLPEAAMSSAGTSYYDEFELPLDRTKGGIQYYRLPAWKMYTYCSFRITGDWTIGEVHLAESMSELANG